MDYEIIIGVGEPGNEQLAIAKATERLLSSIPEVIIWRVDVYDDGAGVGLTFETEVAYDYDEVMAMNDYFESFEEVSTTPIE